MPVEINEVPATFLVDTGADRTIIDSAFAQHLGLTASGTASMVRNYSTEDITTVTPAHVRVGSKLWAAIPLAVLDLSMLSRMTAPPFAGVLGTDLLETLTVKLSYQSGTAEIIPQAANGQHPIILQKVRHRYFVPIRIGHSTFEMLLDSGTNMTALSNSAWRTLHPSGSANGEVEGVQSSGSPPGSLVVCIPALGLGASGPTLLHDQPVRVIMPAKYGSFADTTFAGILGGDVLERFEVTLDLPHSRMYLKSDPGFRRDLYEFVTIGIQFFKVGSDAFSVAAVWKNSPAEVAGIVIGDRILSVNGHSAADLGVEAFANQLHGPAGTPIEIEVERATRRFQLRMSTRQLVCNSATHAM